MTREGKEAPVDSTFKTDTRKSESSQVRSEIRRAACAYLRSFSSSSGRKTLIILQQEPEGVTIHSRSR